MYIRKIDNDRYRRFRNKGLPLYEVRIMSRDDLRETELMEFVREEMIGRFTQRLRARHAFDKKVWRLNASIMDDIDFNTVRLLLEQRFVPVIRKKAS